MNAPVAVLAGETLAPWARARAAEFNRRFADSDAPELLHAAIMNAFRGRIALVSSFGAESAILLHMVAQIDPSTPVVFLDTGQLFAQTLQYVETLAGRFGLTDVRAQRPDPRAVAAEDPAGDLWRRHPDRCCHVRKVMPLAQALRDFDAWISGRKRYQGGIRATIPLAETDGCRVKFNPLALWSTADVDEYFRVHGLPRHPLQEFGFQSIGCHPCTADVAPDTGSRAGRWPGSAKTECGIHGPLLRRAPTGSPL